MNKFLDVVVTGLTAFSILLLLAAFIGLCTACKKRPTEVQIIGDKPVGITVEDKCVSINGDDFYICSKEGYLWLCEDPGYDCFPVAESPVKTVHPVEDAR